MSTAALQPLPPGPPPPKSPAEVLGSREPGPAQAPPPWEGPAHSGPLSPHWCPQQRPLALAVHGPTATQLDVTVGAASRWRETQNGDIQGYKVGVLGRGEGVPGDTGPHGGAWGGTQV